ncbi:MAG: hypothetical protein RL685_3835 [Pseudomonadota bacterium]|jgi:hypothetical protein
MNFEDETYVRLYTRDTKTWLRLGFEGQAVLMLTLRKLDRSGVLDGIDDPASDLALVLGAPVELVRTGLQRLIDCGVIALADGQLVVPNFMQAQNCRQSDRIRKQKSRAERRSAALGTVTSRHRLSPAVTHGHSWSL